MSKISGASIISRMLQGYGVTHVFYVPTILMRSLAEMDSLKIKKILTHSEKAAAYMADGYARASGKPGLCLAQQIGATNLLSGLRDAFMANSPVIAITGGSTNDSKYRNAYQEVEEFKQFDSMTKFNAEVNDTNRLPDLIRQSFRVATTGSPGPVHLRLMGLHGGTIADAVTDADISIEEKFKFSPPFRPVAHPDDINQAIELLLKAERPIIVAGGGVIASNAESELRKLAEKLQIPVATSLNAKASLNDAHSLNVGVVGTYSRSCANKAVFEADTVFFIGSQTGGQVTVNWKIPKSGTKVIQLDINPEELGRNYSNAISLLGDAKSTLAEMYSKCIGKSLQPKIKWLNRVQELVTDWRKENEKSMTSTAIPLRPERICREISESLPVDAVLVSDTGHSGMWTSQMIEIQHSTQKFIRCAGSLGWGLPGAMGVKCALPERPVLCFTGDGGIYYHLSELETAARFGINIVVIVNNNSSLNQEIPLVNAAYKGLNDDQSAEIWKFQKSVDFTKIAENFGCASFRVDKPGQLKDLLPNAFKMNRPVVIEVISDENALSKTAWTP
ncbi:MAG: thiamine pyrophosphate-binding protein [Betaproteobacteria bacterium]